MKIPLLTIDGVREGLLSRQFSATELAGEALRFAETENAITGAYLHFSPERALEILELSVRDNELDPVLYKLFVDAKIYQLLHKTH